MGRPTPRRWWAGCTTGSRPAATAASTTSAGSCSASWATTRGRSGAPTPPSSPPADASSARDGAVAGPRRAAPARRLVACRELPLGRPDLPACEPAPAGAAPTGARQAPPARPLGYDAGPEPAVRAPEPADPPPRRRRAVHRRPGARRPRDVRVDLARGLLHRALAVRHPGRGRHAAPVPAVLVPGRRPEPRRTGDAGFDPRGRRARLLAGSCLRRRARQPRPPGRLRDR